MCSSLSQRIEAEPIKCIGVASCELTHYLDMSNLSMLNEVATIQVLYAETQHHARSFPMHRLCRDLSIDTLCHMQAFLSVGSFSAT